MIEIKAVLKERADQERHANLRAGLIAATIMNVRRKRGASLVKASDFLKEPATDENRMSPKEAGNFMDQWMRRQNALAVGKKSK